MTYTDAKRVKGIRFTSAPRKGKTVSGYGGAIPTDIEIRYLSSDDRPRWYRVKVMQFGNAGSAYIRLSGEDVFLDTDTEYAIGDKRENGYAFSDCVNYATNVYGDCGGRAEPVNGVVVCESCRNNPNRWN